MNWYKTLDRHARITLKEMFDKICGIGWTEADLVFSLREKIEFLEQKLIFEGLL